MALWFAKNITVYYYPLKKDMIERNVIDVYVEYYEKYKFNKEVMDKIIDAIYNLNEITFIDEYNEKYIKIIPIVNTVLSVFNDKHSVKKGLFFLLQLSNQKKLIEHIVNAKLHLLLFNLFLSLQSQHSINLLGITDQSIRTTFKICIVKIIGFLLYGDTIPTQVLIDDKVIDFLNLCLRESDLIIIKNAIFAMGNICGGSIGQVSELHRTQSVFLVLQIGNKVYEELKLLSHSGSADVKKLNEVLYEVCFFSSNAVVSSFYSDLINLVRYQNSIVVFFIMYALEEFKKEEDLVEMSLKAIYRLAVIEKGDADWEEDEDENGGNVEEMGMLNVMNMYGLREKLEDIELCSKKSNIANVASFIYKEIYND